MTFSPVPYGSHSYINAPLSLKYLLAPIKTTAHYIYKRRTVRCMPSFLEALGRHHPHPITVVCISDTHNALPDLPPGDLLLHTGDLANRGHTDDLQRGFDWLSAQRHTHKVFVAGNHDLALDPKYSYEAMKARGIVRSGWRGDASTLHWGSVKYLCFEPITLEFPDRGGRRVKIFGSPYSIERSKRWHNSFQFERAQNKLKDAVPEGTEILMSHGPMRWHRDKWGAGDQGLLEECRRVRPKLVVTGHHHSARGMDALRWDRFQEVYEDVVGGRRGIGGLWEMLGRVWRESDVPIAEDEEEKEKEKEKVEGKTLVVNGSWLGNESKGVTVVKI